MSLPILRWVENNDATQLSIRDFLNQEQNFLDSKTFERDVEGREKQFFNVKLSEIVSEGNQMVMIQFVNVSAKVYLKEKEVERKLLTLINMCISHELKNPLNSLIALSYLNASLVKRLK